MEQRYKQLAQWGVRNIDGYNTEVERRNIVLDFDEDGRPWKTLPYIVIIIDELADLMMTCGTDVEEAITRLAQMARAVGIHLVLATQRPSVDVITGLIKANFPSRIAFRVSSKVDSRTIIDSNGAEQLLGRGDMLFLPPGTSRLLRVHGAYLDENEIAKIVAHIKAQGGEPVYDETITQSEDESSDGDARFGRARRAVRAGAPHLLRDEARVHVGLAATPAHRLRPRRRNPRRVGARRLHRPGRRRAPAPRPRPRLRDRLPLGQPRRRQRHRRLLKRSAVSFQLFASQ